MGSKVSSNSVLKRIRSSGPEDFRTYISGPEMKEVQPKKSVCPGQILTVKEAMSESREVGVGQSLTQNSRDMGFGPKNA